MSGYSTFLARAGADSRTLFETQANAADAAADVTDIYPVLVALGDEIEAAAGDAGSLQEAIQQSAYASTYYVIGATLVSGSAYGLSGFGLGEETSRADEDTLLRNAVESGEDVILGWSAFLQWSGQNMSYPVWQGRWAMSVLDRLRGTPRIGAGAILARNEISYAVISDLMVRSASLNLR